MTIPPEPVALHIECFGGPLDGTTARIPARATDGCVILLDAPVHDEATGVCVRSDLTRYLYGGGRLTYMRPTPG